MDNVKDKRNGTGKFWQRFHDKLISLGVESQEEARRLVKWAEGFAKSMKGPLKSRSAADVLRYLEKIAKTPNLDELQIKQAVLALKRSYTRNNWNRPGRENGSGTKLKPMSWHCSNSIRPDWQIQPLPFLPRHR